MGIEDERACYLPSEMSVWDDKISVMASRSISRDANALVLGGGG